MRTVLEPTNLGYILRSVCFNVDFVHSPDQNLRLLLSLFGRPMCRRHRHHHRHPHEQAADPQRMRLSGGMLEI